MIEREPLWAGKFFLLRLRVLIQIVLEMIFPIEASNLVIPYSNMEKRTVQNPTICG